jgi:hypothetical protein
MTTETLIADAATTPEGAAATKQTTKQSATGAEAGGQQQQTEAQKAEGKAAEGTKAEGEQAKPVGAPETYEFKAAEGVTYDDTVLTAYSEVAKELNLPQESAQKVLDKMAPVLAARQAEQIEAARNTWAESAKSDKEFGGDKLPESLVSAKKALDAFGTPELRTLLNDTGLGNHPDVIRFMVKAGKAISEDRYVGGKGAPPAGKDTASVLYPNQK